MHVEVGHPSGDTGDLLHRISLEPFLGGVWVDVVYPNAWRLQIAIILASRQAEGFSDA
jgi:hypothetical protein